ncbi:T-complex protein 1 subunit zeta [Nematocida minor]|uniref:T-complex protein 1 subunit zeta n=1 Tax=Nematocida minor TaxID=1912983 RepID=UPI00221E9ADC|nr:T-complex protein 1 subunit zeta [Nematocida minor]KAI5192157.1 T-complex protein 1 subunit zeta [Nematocida minor]
MAYLGKETQITQAGQAIVLNTEAISQLNATIRNGFGPNGALKMLITPAGEIRLVKDGFNLLKNIQLAQPGAVLLSKMVTQQGEEYGDGVTSSIILSASMLSKAIEYIYEGVHPQVIIAGLLKREKAILQTLESMKVPIEDTKDTIYNLAYTALRTKFSKKQTEKYSNIIVSAAETVRSGNTTDLKMLEIVKMADIDATEPLRIVKGLVMDHGGRHPMMPRRLENVFILCTNISFEYEKPEHNAQFYYKSTEEKLKMEEGERHVIMQRVQKVLEVIQKVAIANQSQKPQFMIITQKGIDAHVLEIFAKYNILALRRAKRKNMERLQSLTGCTPVTGISELNENVFGFAGLVREISVGDDKFTFIEKTPFNKTCTLLIQGISPYQMEYLESAVKSALKSISCGLSDGYVVPGGTSTYYKLAESLVPEEDTTENLVSYNIWKDSLMSIPKILIKNLGYNSVEMISKIKVSETKNSAIEISTGEIKDAFDMNIIDNYAIVKNTIQSSVLAATKILMIDEIIKSGKEVK